MHMMTSTKLALWISAGIGIQLVVFLAYSFLRHWQLFLSLRDAPAHPDIPDAVALESESPALPVAWSGLRGFRVRQKVLEDATSQVCSFYLEPEDGRALPAFKPGQFLTFKLEIPANGLSGHASEAVTRCYSLSDAPHSDCYRVSIKRAPSPSGTVHAPGRSSNFFHDHVQVGSLLQVRAPSGHFYLDRGHAPVVLIGGGIGITPMLSMINWCASEQPEREVWLFYGARNAAELVMLPHLQALAASHPTFHLHLCFSDPRPEDMQSGNDPATQRHHSRVDVALLRSQLPLKPYHFYLCGPTAMLASLVPALDDWGVPDERIHFEAFGPASVPRRKAGISADISPSSPSHAEPVLVTFSRTGKQLPWSQGMGSLLDFAEANGIAVDSGCRSGSCGTCQTTIQSGEVHYLQVPDSDPEPGTCLLCVSVPTTAVTLEA